MRFFSCFLKNVVSLPINSASLSLTSSKVDKPGYCKRFSAGASRMTLSLWSIKKIKKYYDNSRPLFGKEEKHLVVFARMPIVSEEHLYRFFEIRTFPVPITVPGLAKKDALQIIGLLRQVALSLS